MLSNLVLELHPLYLAHKVQQDCPLKVGRAKMKVLNVHKIIAGVLI